MLAITEHRASRTIMMGLFFKSFDRNKQTLKQTHDRHLLSSIVHCRFAGVWCQAWQECARFSGNTSAWMSATLLLLLLIVPALNPGGCTLLRGVGTYVTTAHHQAGKPWKYHCLRRSRVVVLITIQHFRCFLLTCPSCCCCPSLCCSSHFPPR